MDTDEPIRRIHDAGAPSWSWASVNCRVEFQDLEEEDQPLASVQHADLDFLDLSNRFGALRSGRLTLRGRLVKANMTLDTEAHKNMNLVTDIEGTVKRHRFTGVFSSVQEFETIGGSKYFLPIFWTTTHLMRARGGASEQLLVRDVLATAKNDRQETWKNHRIHDLLLLQ